MKQRVTRSRIVAVRINPYEELAIASICEATGLSISDVIRRSMLLVRILYDDKCSLGKVIKDDIVKKIQSGDIDVLNLPFAECSYGLEQLARSVGIKIE